MFPLLHFIIFSVKLGTFLLSHSSDSTSYEIKISHKASTVVRRASGNNIFAREAEKGKKRGGGKKENLIGNFCLFVHVYYETFYHAPLTELCSRFCLCYHVS